MTDSMTHSTLARSGAHAALEKIALETYVPPAKPSLVGLSRAELADQLGAIGVAAAQRKMRVLDLCPRRPEFRRDDQHFQGNAHPTRFPFHG
jgi:23S rRNA (adenine2503-C2)-methyltransferase